MNGSNQIGAFRGRKLIQTSGTIGGAKSVFVKLQGIKNELVYPTFGGQIKNPFKGAAKAFAGDLCWYKTDANGVKPEIYILKTYKVAHTVSSQTKIQIVRDGYKHIPFVGDKLAVAPAKIGGAVTTLTVVGVEAKAGEWELTLSSSASVNEGDILVESNGSKMLVEHINGVIDCDIDMLDAPATGDEDFDGARYMYTPALSGVMYTNKMSPMPKCVLDLNKSTVNGWFKVEF